MPTADSPGHERVAPGVDREGLEFRPTDADGLIGTLVIPPLNIRRDAAVVALGGSQGGLDEQDAIAFAQAGFTALALAYFGAGSTLPRALVELPLEYVRLAIEWIRSQPELADRRVGLVGRSKGGELALQVAATYPEHVGAVVGYASSPVVWQGLPADRRGWREEPKSSWTLDGNPVPFLPFAKPRARSLPRFVASMIAGNAALRPMYERALADTEARKPESEPRRRSSRSPARSCSSQEPMTSCGPHQCSVNSRWRASQATNTRSPTSISPMKAPVT